MAGSNPRFAAGPQRLAATGTAAEVRVHPGRVEEPDTGRRYDLIVSGPPFAHFTPPQVEAVMDGYPERLRPGGVLTHFAHRGTRKARALVGRARPARRHRAVYDYAYRGCGNWAFNAAYPARYRLLGLVTRLRPLSQPERLVLAGVPVATAQAARSSELGGYAAAGNIMVVRGFTAHGDVVVNDPLSPGDDTVRRTYPRGESERVRLSGGGVVYLVHPPDRALPAHAPGTIADR